MSLPFITVNNRCMDFDRTRVLNNISFEIPQGKIVGVIENMSGKICPYCKETINLFSKDGGKKAAEDMGVHYLGAIPLDPDMVKPGDEGRPYNLQHAESPTRKAVDAVMKNLVDQVES